MLTKFELFLEGKWFGGGRAAKAGPNAPVVVPNQEQAKKKVYDKPDDDIIEWMINYLKKTGVDETKLTDDYNLSPKTFEPKQWWEYKFIKQGKTNPLDPYGEEDWPGATGNKQINIRIEKRSLLGDKYEYYYRFKVNDNDLDVSEKYIKRIVELLDAPKEARRLAREKREAEAKKSKNDAIRRDLFEKRSK